jgi:hypothetical protein
VTSLRHTPVALEDPLEREVLTRLDGTRDRTALIAEMTSDESGSGNRVDAALQRFAREGLLLA